MHCATVNELKEMTRRIAKYNGQPIPTWWNVEMECGKFMLYDSDNCFVSEIKPRYKVGEKVYLKEPYIFYDLSDFAFWIEYKDLEKREFCWSELGISERKADLLEQKILTAMKEDRIENPRNMPEKFARHFIEITAVRCERLQDISNEDCLKEGIKPSVHNKHGTPITYIADNVVHTHPRLTFAALINKAYKKGTWEANPYVWVYEFKLIKK